MKLPSLFGLLGRAKTSFKARYDAAGNGRRMRGWKATSTGPNQATQGLQTIRDRTRDSVRNDWLSSAGLQRWVTNLVGTGIVTRCNKRIAKTRRDKIERVWNDWMKRSDADGVLSFYGLQALATRSWLESGEVFVRLRFRDDTFDLEVPLQLQLIEADFIPTFDSDSWPGMPPGNKIRQGIELDRRGQRVAYWAYREHPGDFRTAVSTTSNLIRVLADEMLHIFEPKRPGQLRGVPDFAPVLSRIRNTIDYDDGVMERMKLSNLFAGFIKKPAPSGYTDDIDPLTGQAIDYDRDGSPMVGLEPGLMQELLPGEEIQWSNPPEAGTTYSEYMRTQHVGTTAGQHVPYEVVTGDIYNISDRTLRITIQEFRRHAEQRQWTILIPQFVEKVRDSFADAAILSGALSIREGADAKDVTHTPQGWAYIHPTQDAQAEQMLIEAGLSSRSAAIAKRGDDPETIDQERADDAAREQSLGLPATNQPKNPAVSSGQQSTAPQDPTQGDTQNG